MESITSVGPGGIIIRLFNAISSAIKESTQPLTNRNRDPKRVTSRSHSEYHIGFVNSRKTFEITRRVHLNNNIDACHACHSYRCLSVSNSLASMFSCERHCAKQTEVKSTKNSHFLHFLSFAFSRFSKSAKQLNLYFRLSDI